MQNEQSHCQSALWSPSRFTITYVWYYKHYEKYENCPKDVKIMYDNTQINV